LKWNFSILNHCVTTEGGFGFVTTDFVKSIVERSQFIISKSHQPNVTFQSFTFEVLIRLRQINEKNDDDFVSLNRQKKPMHSNIPLYMKNGMIALALQWERCTSKI